MFNRVQLGRIAVVCIISLSLGPVWARGGGGRGGGVAPAAGGFRGGAGAGAPAGRSAPPAPAGGPRWRPLTSTATAGPISWASGPTGRGSSR